MATCSKSRFQLSSLLFGVICGGVIAFALCILFLPPKTVYVDRPVEVIKEVIKEVPVEVIRESHLVITYTQEVPVDRVVYQNIPTKRWDSIEQFTDWYWAQEFTVLFGVGCRPAICVDYAEWVAEKALAQGYLVSCQLTDFNGYIAGYKVSSAWHMGNLVIAGDGLYWVEPNPQEFKTIRIGQKD